AERFNSRFGETLVVPRATTPPAGARIMDLQDPTSKMSKSTSTEAGAIGLLDDAAAIDRKFRRAVTDSLGRVAYEPDRQPGVSNLLEILAAVTHRSPADVARGYQAYGPLKSDTGAAVIEMLAPIQARYLELMKDPAELTRLLRIASAKAHEVAAATLDRVHAAIGLLPA
ncbi:MAG: tryptophan--tRNA ligase, partial [Acidimicrobiia bacterium]|nr:tryptophan--tRNA ligase [Acidimicrobiia bacterium]